MEIACVLIATRFALVGAAPKPHIVFFMADDLGHANVGWHRQQDSGSVPLEVQTPNMDALVSAGIDLKRAYAFMFCSPTRSSFLSGRLPLNVNMLNTDPAAFDAVSGEGAGIATNMTGIATVLAKGGYSTAVVGKWDAGMDYWTSTVSNNTDGFCSHDSNIIDLWHHDINSGNSGGPAIPRPGGADADVYEEEIFRYLDRMLNVTELSLTGQGYAAMVAVADDALGNITTSLKEAGMWEDTLLVFMSDNGGPIYDQNFKETGGCPDTNRPGMTGPAGREPFRSTCLDFGGAASNHPLRGGKESFWEGGVRVPAFISGGFVPAAQRGTAREQLIAAADWYSTFAALARVDPTDTTAAAYDLPPIDSFDQTAVLFPEDGAAVSAPRANIVLGKTAIISVAGSKLYKLIVGTTAMDAWVGPRYPNASTFGSAKYGIKNCKDGCLFDVSVDPTEHDDIASTHPDVIAALTDVLSAAAKKAFEPSRGAPQQAACDAARGKYKGHYGPFV
eukprot:gene2649-14137_t